MRLAITVAPEPAGYLLNERGGVVSSGSGELLAKPETVILEYREVEKVGLDVESPR